MSTAFNDVITDLNVALIALNAKDRLQVLDLLPPIIKAATDATVAELRAEGATWAEIGEVLGVTRQAAQIRFRTATDEKDRT